jgi:hypothetical protein
MLGSYLICICYNLIQIYISSEVSHANCSHYLLPPLALQLPISRGLNLGLVPKDLDSLLKTHFEARSVLCVIGKKRHVIGRITVQLNVHSFDFPQKQGTFTTVE